MGAMIDTKKRGNGRARFRPRAEINVTPFVDVMLVLLIVFMVSAPLIAVGELVDPPNANSPSLPVAQDPLVVQITTDGRVFLQETEIERETLMDRVNQIRQAREEAGGEMGVVLVRGDAQAQYQAVFSVLAELRGAGLSAGLVADSTAAEN